MCVRAYVVELAVKFLKAYQKRIFLGAQRREKFQGLSAEN